MKVARIIEACLPDFNSAETGALPKIEFTFCHGDKEILRIDSKGWIYVDTKIGGTWDGFIEGSVEKVAEFLLKPVAQRGFRVMQPPRNYDFENPPAIKNELKI